MIKLRNRSRFGLVACSFAALLCVHTEAADKVSRSKPALAAGRMGAAQVRKEIQAVYDQQSAALSRKDVKGFLALCTPDYQDLVWGKRLYSAGFIRQSLPRTLAKYSALKMTAAIQTLQVQGSRATATAAHHATVTLLPRYGAATPNRSTETMTEDVWIRTAQGWRTKHSKEIGYKQIPVPQPPHRPFGSKPFTRKTAAPPAR